MVASSTRGVLRSAFDFSRRFLGFGATLGLVIAACGDEQSEAVASARQAIDPAPVWYETQHFFSSAPISPQAFGRSIALSGNFALIAALHDAAGAVYAFERVNDVWTEQQKIVPPDSAKTDCFGTSVAMYGDRALIGQPCFSGALNRFPSAYLYQRVGSTWTLEKQLFASGSATDPSGPPQLADGFGTSVALDADSALVGAPNHSLPGASTGPAPNSTPTAGLIYAFSSSAGWAQQAVLNTGTANDSIGQAMALSAGVLLYGRAHNAGLLWTTKQGSQWPATAVAAECGGNGACGSVVAISEAYSVTAGTTPAPQVTVISNSDHSQRTILTDPENTLAGFGSALAISGDTIFVGKNNAGVYVFKRSGSVWNFSQKIVPNDGILTDYFGSAIALSDTTALIGAFTYPVATASPGAVYVETFSVPKPDGSPCAANPQCANANCVEGVCCNEACTNRCQSCLALNTLQLQGTCANVVANTDPYQACTEHGSTCPSSGLCDGSGHCGQCLPPSDGAAGAAGAGPDEPAGGGAAPEGGAHSAGGGQASSVAGAPSGGSPSSAAAGQSESDADGGGASPRGNSGNSDDAGDSAMPPDLIAGSGAIAVGGASNAGDSRGHAGAAEPMSAADPSSTACSFHLGGGRGLDPRAAVWLSLGFACVSARRRRRVRQRSTAAHG